RRVVAAALAGYVAINVSALCAAVEFGIQPILFKDVTGAPLYAPYPLSIAIPAMLIGHLTFAGLAELIISGGVVAYIQRSDPSLLKLTAKNARDPEGEQPDASPRSGWQATRPLWMGLCLLMILSPIGLLAAGTAWGEWGAKDFKDPQMRQQIAVASANTAPPLQPPRGLAKLSSVWTAPMPDYAPRFLKSAKLGYVLSAGFGAGLILLAFLFFGWAAEKFGGTREPDGVV
nr:PDGLE domain-containing protein [Armatimonadota bacterium]